MTQIRRIRISTNDGSHTLYHEKLGEHYHSVHGALQESMHVFIVNGLQHMMKDRDSLRIFEVGLGTGLNAMLTALEAVEHGWKINYDAIEAYPLESADIEGLNYPALSAKRDAELLLHEIHRVSWGEKHEINNEFHFRKFEQQLQSFKADQSYDLLYFDAFGPNSQPELWEQTVLDQVAGMLKDGGVLVTYCAKGSVKRGLKAAGLDVEALPGPPGKREMTRARKISR